MKKQNIQESTLFNESVSCIDCYSSSLNIVHKKSVTSTISNNNIICKNPKDINLKIENLKTEKLLLDDSLPIEILESKCLRIDIDITRLESQLLPAIT